MRLDAWLKENCDEYLGDGKCELMCAWQERGGVCEKTDVITIELCPDEVYVIKKLIVHELARVTAGEGDAFWRLPNGNWFSLISFVEKLQQLEKDRAEERERGE